MARREDSIIAGTKIGGLKCAAVNKAKYGENFYRDIGKRGGLVKGPKGFATNLDLAREAGAKGGSKSKRGKKVIKIPVVEEQRSFWSRMRSRHV